MMEMVQQSFRVQPSADEIWYQFQKPIVTGDDYVESLFGRNLKV